MQAAEQSQQRGERRSGHEAIPHFEDAVQKYRQCMIQDPDAETLTNAQVLCSETLQLWAKAILAVEEHLPDSEQSISVERNAQRQARELYSEAVQVRTCPGHSCISSVTATRQPCTVTTPSIVPQQALYHCHNGSHSFTLCTFTLPQCSTLC